MDELYNAIDIIKKYIGTEAYEICLISNFSQVRFVCCMAKVNILI